MEHPVLGRLDRACLETLLRAERSDFADWFAHPDLLKTLGNTLGFTLEPEGEPVSALGRAGLVCRDAGTGCLVAIEAQLGESRHHCLGRLLVRASETGADASVWLAERFVPEHLLAVQGLNRGADDLGPLLGVEIGLWRIGASPAALRFDVVAQPEIWPRRAGGTAPRRARRTRLPGQPRARKALPACAPDRPFPRP